MIIDHIGLFFFPQFIIFRIIGRVSFPLFAWLIANGAYHTRNKDLYLKRLLILACLSQIPFILAHVMIGYPSWFLNVVFTLSLGLAAIILVDKTKDILKKILIIFLITSLAFIFNSDYSFVGVLSILCFYYFYSSPGRMFLSQIFVFSLPLILSLVQNIYYQDFVPLKLINFIPFVGLPISLACIYLYKGREGFKAKYLFYLFYPLQYIIILILKYYGL